MEPEAYIISNTIVLKKGLYPPRANWRFCHELGHLVLGHNKTGERITKLQEQEADEFASETLLPMDVFNPLAQSTNDLKSIKEQFSHASWEAIARKFALVNNCVITVYDNRNITSRWAPEGVNYPRIPSDIERQAMITAYENLSNESVFTDEISVDAHYIDENEDIKRVILITTINIE